MAENPPAWAWAEVDRRVEYKPPTTAMEWARHADELRTLAATLIAEHEEPPVDPLVETLRASLDRIGPLDPQWEGTPAECHKFAEILRTELAKRGLKIVEAEKGKSDAQ